jgi:hypothetical protein
MESGRVVRVGKLGGWKFGEMESLSEMESCRVGKLGVTRIGKLEIGKRCKVRELERRSYEMESGESWRVARVRKLGRLKVSVAKGVKLESWGVARNGKLEEVGEMESGES